MEVFIIRLYINTLKYLLKNKLVWLFSIIVILYVAIDILPKYKYEYTQIDYENNMGYLRYSELQNCKTEEDFYDIISKKKGRRVYVDNTIFPVRLFEDNIINAVDRDIFYRYKSNQVYHKKNDFNIIYDKYIKEDKIIDYGYYTFNDLKNIDEDTYNTLKHSLYTANGIFSSNSWLNSIDIYLDFLDGKRQFSSNDPYDGDGFYSGTMPYKYAKIEMEKRKNYENLSAPNARFLNYFITISFIMITSFLYSVNICEDYKYSSKLLIKGTVINSFKYITSKFLAFFTIFFISGIFNNLIIYMFKRVNYIDSGYIYSISDFVYYLFVYFCVALFFMLSFTLVLSLYTKNQYITTAIVTMVSFGTIMMYSIDWYVVVPRVSETLWGIGYFINNKILIQRAIHIVISFVLIFLSNIKWKKDFRL